jgi:uncharacterized RDD family membrane protein YckC
VLPARTTDTRRWITPEPLNVAPGLIGLPLARPQQRAMAMAADLLVVALLSGVSGFWLVGGLVLVVLQLRSRRGEGTPMRALLGWLFAALLALLALQALVQGWNDEPDPAPPAAVLKGQPPASDPVASAPAPSAAERIEVLQAELAEARRPRPLSLRDEFDRVLDAAGASFGWGIVYFSLLPAWWGGQTLGKKLFGLRVLELTGRPMTVLLCLKRYGGYAAGMATGGLGFLQLIWDQNRQALQDKAAHTVVVDLRAAPAHAQAASN